MTYNEAKRLISNMLDNQRLTVHEHLRVKEAWELVLSCAEKEHKDGDDAVHVSGAIQQSQ